MYQEFVIGVSAGILPIEFLVMSTIGISFSHFDSEFGLGRDAPSYRISVLDSKNCLDLVFVEKVYGFLCTEDLGLCGKSNLLSM